MSAKTHIGATGTFYGMREKLLFFRGGVEIICFVKI